MECCKLWCMELNSIGTLQNTNSSVVGKVGPHGVAWILILTNSCMVMESGEVLLIILIIRVRSWLCFLVVVLFRSFKGGSCKVVSLGSSASSMMQQVSSKESDAVGFFSFPASDPSFIPSCFSTNSRVVQRHWFYFPPFPELACASCLMENYTSWLKIAENKMEIFYCQFVLSKLFVIVVFTHPNALHWPSSATFFSQRMFLRLFQLHQFSHIMNWRFFVNFIYKQLKCLFT